MAPRLDDILSRQTSPYAWGTPRGGVNPRSLAGLGSTGGWGSALETPGERSRLLQPPPPPNYDISDYQLGGPLYQSGAVSRDQPFNYFNAPSYMATQGTQTGLNPALNNILGGVAATAGSALGSSLGRGSGTSQDGTPPSQPEGSANGGGKEIPPDPDPNGDSSRLDRWGNKVEEWLENPLIRLGTQLGVGALADKLGGGLPGVPDAANLLAQQAANAQYGRQIASQLGPVAQQLLGGATQSFSPVANMWSGLLTGGRGRLTNLLAPEIGEITEAYRAPTQAAANLQPRGGARASLMAQLPYQRARDIATLFQQARPLAAEGLLQTGQAQAAAGMAGYENLANLLSGADLAGYRLGEYNLARQENRAEESRGVGKTIMDALIGGASAVAGGGDSGANGAVKGLLG